MTGDRLLTVQEVADRLRVNRETVRRWLRSGQLRGIKLGGDRAGFRIGEEVLREFLSKRSTVESAGQETSGRDCAKG